MKWLFIILLSSCAPTQTVLLDGSKSYADTGSWIVKYKWSGSGIINTDSMRTYASVKKGDVIKLTVTDNTGLSNDTTTVIK